MILAIEKKREQKKDICSRDIYTRVVQMITFFITNMGECFLAVLQQQNILLVRLRITARPRKR